MPRTPSAVPQQAAVSTRATSGRPKRHGNDLLESPRLKDFLARSAPALPAHAPVHTQCTHAAPFQIGATLLPHSAPRAALVA
jgi:hypothetical protein